MRDLSLQDILRASHTMRFTIVNTIKPQSVAEHTFNVVMIARRIAKVLDVPDGNLIKLALEHDLDEIITGDIPTPTKRKMEKAWGVDIDSLYPHNGNNVATDLEWAILKMADFLDAIVYLTDNAVGRHAEQVLDGIKRSSTKHLMASFEPDHRSLITDKVINPLKSGELTI